MTLPELLADPRFTEKGLEGRTALLDQYWDGAASQRPEESEKVGVMRQLSKIGHESGYVAKHGPAGPDRDFHEANLEALTLLYNRARKGEPGSPEWVQTLTDYGKFREDAELRAEGLSETRRQVREQADAVLEARNGLDDRRIPRGVLDTMKPEESRQINESFREMERVSTENIRDIILDSTGRFKLGDEEILIEQAKLRRGQFTEPFRVGDDRSLHSSVEAFLLPKEEAIEQARKSGAARMEVEAYEKSYDERREQFTQPIINAAAEAGIEIDADEAIEGVRKYRDASFRLGVGKGIRSIGQFANKVPIFGKFSEKGIDSSKLEARDRLFEMVEQYASDRFKPNLWKELRGAVGAALPDLATSFFGAGVARNIAKGFGASKAAQTTAALAGAGGLPGLKSATETFEQAKELGRSDGEAAKLAFFSFFSEAGPTMVFGRSGVEKLFVPGVTRETVKSGVLNTAKRFAKDSGMEIAEEEVSTISDILSVQLSLNPDMTIDDALTSTRQAAMAAGVLGLMGGFERGSAPKNTPLESRPTREPAPEPEAPEVPEAAAPVEPTTLPEDGSEVPATEPPPAPSPIPDTVAAEDQAFLREVLGVVDTETAREELGSILDAETRGELTAEDVRAKTILEEMLAESEEEAPVTEPEPEPAPPEEAAAPEPETPAEPEPAEKAALPEPAPEAPPLTLESATEAELAQEAKQRQQREAVREGAAAKLEGRAGDLTADMFSEGETPLFNERRDTPKKEAEPAKKPRRFRVWNPDDNTKLENQSTVFQIRNNFGRMESRSAAKKRLRSEGLNNAEAEKRLTGLYEGAPTGRDPSLSSLIYGGEVTPDQMAENLGFERVDEMWEAIGKDRQAARTARDAAAQETEGNKQAQDFWDAATEQDVGEEAIDPSELVKGSKLTIDGTPMTVIRVTTDEDGSVEEVLMKDGPRFGVQKVLPGQTLFVEQVEDPEPQQAGDVMMFSSIFPDIRPLIDIAKRAETPLRRVLQDQFIDLRNSQRSAEAAGIIIPDSQDAYQASDLHPGVVGQRLVEVKEEFLEPFLSDLRQTRVPNALVELESLSYALHAPERNAHIASINPLFPDGGSGMTDADAAQVVADMRADGRYAALKPLHDRLMDFNRAALQEKVDAGLIPQKAYDLLTTRYQNYVPLRGFEGATEEESSAPQQGRGFQARRGQIRAALGRGSRATDLFAYSVQQHNDAISEGERNRVSQSILQLADSRKTPDIVERASPTMTRRRHPITGQVERVADPQWLNRPDNANVVMIKVLGKEHYVRILHPKLAQNWKNMGSDTFGHLGRILQTSSVFTRFLAAVNTQWNPEFALPNFARDLQTALINISETDAKGIHAQVVRDVLPAMRGVWQEGRGAATSAWAAEAREFAERGGKMVFFGLKDFDHLKKEIGRTINRAGRHPYDIRNGFRAVGKFIGDANGAVENATRLAVYANLKRAGMTEKKAAAYARNVTVNFTKKGELGTAINALYLFYNAGIQGSVRMLSGARRSAKVRRVMGSVVALGFAQELLNRLGMSDEDDETGLLQYDQVPEHVKERNMVFMVDGDKTVTIPLPYGYNVLHNLGRNAAAVMMGAKSKETAAIDTFFAFAGSFNPIGGLPNFTEEGVSIEDSALVTIAPAPIRAVAEAAAGVDALGRPLKPASFPTNPPTPESQQFFSRSSKPARAAAEMLNEMTGGNQVRSGWFDFSPEVLDHIFDSWAGGLGATGRRATDTMMRLVKKEPVEIENIPITRRFLSKVPRWQSQQTYYALRQEIATLREERKQKTKIPEDMKGLASAAMEERMKATHKLVVKKRKQIQAAGTPAEKLAREDELAEIIERFIGSAVKTVGSGPVLRSAR